MNSKSKSLSLVIPAYNEERYLAACLDAVAAQSVMPDEVIVVDNNSTDATVRIARRYPFVRLIREKRQGLRFSRNAGLDAATGDILGRIDADTVLEPDWCENALAAFTAHEVHAVTGPCYYHDMPLLSLGFALDRNIRRTLYRIAEPVLYGSNMLISRQAWLSIRRNVCMEGEFFEDLDMSIHLNEAGYTVVFDAEIVVGVSARRLDDSPREFLRNMSQFDATFIRHGLRWAGSFHAKNIYYASYATCKFWRHIYDPETGSIRWAKLLKPIAPRPTSNT